jgi:hypothetical protein
MAERSVSAGFQAANIFRGPRPVVSLCEPAPTDKVVVDRELAAIFEFDGEVAPGNLVAPPFIVDAPGIEDGADALEAALDDESGWFFARVCFDGGGPWLVQEP